MAHAGPPSAALAAPRLRSNSAWRLGSRLAPGQASQNKVGDKVQFRAELVSAVVALLAT